MIRIPWLLILAASAAYAGPIYSVEVLQTPVGWSQIGVKDLNDSGQASGYAVVNGVGVGFISTTSGYTPVAAPQGWTILDIGGINDAGQVAGSGYNGNTDQPFVGTSSSGSAIPLPAGWTEASGDWINGSGQVMGNGLLDDSTNLAFIGTTSGSVAIPLPAGSTGASGLAINNLAQIVGSAGSGSAVSFAFIGNTSTASAIPIPGNVSSSAVAINEAGEVAGEISFNFGTQAFIGNASGYSLIPLPSGASSVGVSAGGINDSGVVVGYGPLGGWIWDPINGTILLNALVSTGWDVWSASAINNNGVILASGTYNNGPLEFFELVPVPEPATGVLAAAEFLFLAALWHRRTRVPRRRPSIAESPDRPV